MTLSGIDPVDGSIGGLAAGRVHVLTGAPGAGKSAVCLQFLGAGLRRGEPALLLTTQQPRDVRALATFMGIDLRLSLLEERLALLCYAPEFAQRLQRAAAGPRALEELRQVVSALAPARIVVDSVLPMLDDGTANGATVAALAELIASTGATALVTCPGDLAQSYDRRLDALVQHAAAIIHLARDGRVGSRVEVVKGPAVPERDADRIVVVAGRGVMAVAPAAASGNGIPPRRARPGRLLLLHGGDTPEPETMAMLGRARDITARPARPGQLDGLPMERVDALIVEASHTMLDDTLAMVYELAMREQRVPIVAFARFNVRSADRARLLRAGADDTLAGDMSAAELQHRLDLAIAHGRAAVRPQPPHETTLARQPTTGGKLVPLGEPAFARALGAYDAQDAPGSVLDLAADGASPELLAEVALRSIRAGGGDLVALVPGGVTVYLHGARRRDTSSFVERLRLDWARHERSPLRVAVRPSSAIVTAARAPGGVGA